MFDEEGEKYSDGSHIEILVKTFPNLTIGRGLDYEGYKILNTDPYYFFYKQIFSETLNCFPTNLPRRSHFSQ